MRERAGDASDASTLGAGAPADFPVEALAGLDALMRLDEGSLGLSGGAWSLSGRAGSGAARELALAALAPLGQARPWTVAIEAPEDIAERPAEETPPAPAVAAETPVAPEPQIPPAAPEPPAPQAVSEPQAAPQPPAPPAPEPALAAPAPAAPEAPAATPAPVTLASLAPPSPGSVATPDPMPARFLFEARRDEEGAVAFSGLVPDEVSRTALADYAPVDGLTLGSGMPADFLDSAGAGLAALDRMVDGRMGFGDGVWALKGEAATASDRYAILAALGTAPGGRWRTDVSVMAPLRFCEVRVARFAERNAILFRSGSDAITDDSLPAIDELAGNLQQCPEATISVIGHTDSDGAEDLNLALSVARAEAVAAALAARGINPERLYSVGYGESLPVADNATAAGKQRNRRIAFEIRDET
jgi:outer membrane protein OmpA-like peptidoglycan-associated protein